MKRFRNHAFKAVVLATVYVQKNTDDFEQQPVELGRFNWTPSPIFLTSFVANLSVGASDTEGAASGMIRSSHG